MDTQTLTLYSAHTITQKTIKTTENLTKKNPGFFTVISIYFDQNPICGQVRVFTGLLAVEVVAKNG